MEFRNVKFEKVGAVGYITLNNPAKRNPINIDTHRELRECFDLCDYDDEIRAVVIRENDISSQKLRIFAYNNKYHNYIAEIITLLLCEKLPISHSFKPSY